MNESTTVKTKQMIDDLKTICTTFGLGGSPGEYKIITEVFLYKYLNDKFLYEMRLILPKLSEEEFEKELKELEDSEYMKATLEISASTAEIQKEHLLSSLFNKQNDDGAKPFHQVMDDAFVSVANDNLEIFSIKTGGAENIRLFEPISNYVIDSSKRNDFAKAIVNKLISVNFEDLFQKKYDFFSQIFEYLIKDYNKDFGQYAEYYTPQVIASIISRILVPKGDQNVTLYDPSAGSGTLALALAHEIGEDKCTIYTQDISSKSNEFLRLNLILNNLVHSLHNVVMDDTLLHPRHMNERRNDIRKFDYIVSNPPFKMDFSGIRDTLASENYSKRFFAGVPTIPKKKKDGMEIYLLFIQHIIKSLADNGKAAIVVPSGFLTDTGAIQTTIRDHVLTKRLLKAVVQMPSNVFANTNTSVSVLFFEKGINNDDIIFVDASKLGKSIKINDVARVVLSSEDEDAIINSITKEIIIPEFSVKVNVSDIEENGGLIKPGLYFDMKYNSLKNYRISESDEIKKAKQKKAGLLRTIRSVYVRNLFIKWFVDFDFPDKSNKLYETEYGNLPIEFELVQLRSLIETALGGEWGKEDKQGKYIHPIKCIRGTDINNIRTANYQDVPTRYVQGKHIDEKQVRPNDMVIEISGGSPIQSTGRVCLITEEILDDLIMPVLCTNFCRIIRLEEPEMAEYVYNYLLLLYDRKYFFNLENNTTGIKNLIFGALIKNIKIPVPKDKNLLSYFYADVNEYCNGISI